MKGRASLRARSGLTVLMSLLLAMSLPDVALAQAGGSSREDDGYEIRRRPFAIDLVLAGIFDSNINHDEDDIDSHGVATGLEALVQTSPRRPLLTLRYEAKLKSFSRSDRWDRLEHELEARLAKRLGALTLETTGRIDFRSTTEDRELGNQYTLRQRVALTSGAARLRLFGALRARSFDQPISTQEVSDDPDEVESTAQTMQVLYAGAELRLRLGSWSSWTLSYRYEDSNSKVLDRRYFQQRFTAEFRSDFTDRNVLQLGLQYKPRRYPDRLVEVDTLDEETGATTVIEEPREDARWIPYASLSYDLPSGQEVELEYEYQRRSSNDLDKEFEAHRVTLTARLPVISRYRRTPIQD